MDKHLNELLINSTREVFETMSFLEVIQDEPLLEHTEVLGTDISAQISIAGKISGMLALHCSKEFAEECFEMIAAADGSACSTSELCDTVGELTNMIVGTLKRRISTQIDLFDLSLPSVSFAPGQIVVYAGAKENFPRIFMPFAVNEQQKFYIEFLYHKMT